MPFLVNQLPKGPYFGIVAEFGTPADLFHACERVRDAGFTRWDAHTPFPVHGLEGAMGIRRSLLPWIVLIAGLTGAVFGFGLQWWVHASAYPLVISGKPYFSWPAFIPITFEVMVLVAAFAALLASFFLSGLPRPHHPVFNEPRFARASQDRFFLCIETTDPRFDMAGTRDFLAGLRPYGPIMEVPE